jgi:hypothetical protein
VCGVCAGDGASLFWSLCGEGGRGAVSVPVWRGVVWGVDCVGVCAHGGTPPYQSCM